MRNEYFSFPNRHGDHRDSLRAASKPDSGSVSDLLQKSNQRVKWLAYLIACTFILMNNNLFGCQAGEVANQFVECRLFCPAQVVSDGYSFGSQTREPSSVEDWQIMRMLGHNLSLPFSKEFQEVVFSAGLGNFLSVLPRVGLALAGQQVPKPSQNKPADQRYDRGYVIRHVLLFLLGFILGWCAFGIYSNAMTSSRLQT